MKKILAGAGLLCASAFVIQAQQQKAQPVPQQTGEAKVSYREEGSVLPPLRVIDGKMNEYTEKSFRNDHHFFMFLFNPTCGHCIDMAKLMGAHADEFKKNHVLFLAGPAMMPYLGHFFQASGIDKHPEIKVGIDSASAVDRLYNYRMLPQVNIYDKDRKLVKIFYGDVPLDSLKKYVP